MDKTDLNALAQSTERSLHFKCKNRFSIKQYKIIKKQFTRIFALPGLKNHDLLRHCVFDDCGYTSDTFSICTVISHGRERQRKRAYFQVWNLTTCMTMAIHVSSISVFLSSNWQNECCVGFSVTSSHGRAKIWIPTSGWFLRIRECRPTKIWPFPPHSLLPTLDIVATIKTDISSPEI